MDSQINPRMDWEATDLPNAFRKFKEHCQFMFGGPLEKKSEEAQCNYFMLWVGEKGRQIFSTWNVTDENKKLLQTYYTGFQEYCAPKVNHIYSRFRFKSCVQKEGQSFEEFVTELKLLIKDCGYVEDIQQEMIRDHIVFGIQSHQIREKMINEGSALTLDKCIDLARTYQLSQTHLKDISGQDHSVSMVRRSTQNTQQNNDQQKSRKQNYTYQNNQCNNCGTNHSERDMCPAKGKTCLYCSRLNHFVRVCRKKKQDYLRTNKKVNEVTNFNTTDLDCLDSPSSTEDSFHVGTIEHDKLKNQAFAKVVVCSTLLNMKIDTGAQVNVIPRSIYTSLGKTGPLQSTQIHLTAYNGQPLKVDGLITLPCTYNDNTTHEEFYIVDTNSSPVVGLQTCLKLNLVKLVLATSCNTPVTKTEVLSKYSDVFTGIGKLPGECEIHLHEDVTPVIHPPRKIPLLTPCFVCNDNRER